MNQKRWSIDEIIDEVFYGRMSPSDAEKLAFELGFGNLVGKPNVAIFDPAHEGQWNPVQVIAWIAYRDFRVVREVSNGYRKLWYRWEPTGQIQSLSDPSKYFNGYQRGLVGPVWISTLAAREDKTTDNNKIDVARRDLLDALKSRSLAARGVSKGTVTSKIISAEEWVGLNFVRDDQARDSLGGGYDRIIMDSDDVLKVWDARSEETESASETPVRKVKNKGGRPEKFSWDEIWMEIVRIANTPDGLPDTRNDLSKMILDWLMEKRRELPASSTLSGKIGPLYDYLGK